MGVPLTYKSWDDPPTNPPEAIKDQTKIFFEALFPEELPEIGRRTRGGEVGGWESWGNGGVFFLGIHEWMSHAVCTSSSGLGKVD